MGSEVEGEGAMQKKSFAGSLGHTHEKNEGGLSRKIISSLKRGQGICARWGKSNKGTARERRRRCEEV